MAQMVPQASGSLSAARDWRVLVAVRRRFDWTVLVAVNILAPLQAQVRGFAYEDW
jgi:hypothetical protein